jgi:RimJ/RimL family protein N-acetyltransferase
MPDNFVRKLEHDCAMLYVVESDGDRVGASSLYEYSRPNGTMWLDVVMLPAYAERRHEATSLALENAFANWSVRKVYAVHQEFESSPFEGLDCRWQREGHFKDRVRIRGRFWDQYISAVYRDDWYRVSGGHDDSTS